LNGQVKAVVARKWDLPLVDLDRRPEGDMAYRGPIRHGAEPGVAIREEGLQRSDERVSPRERDHVVGNARARASRRTARHRQVAERRMQPLDPLARCVALRHHALGDHDFAPGFPGIFEAEAGRVAVFDLRAKVGQLSHQTRYCLHGFA